MYLTGPGLISTNGPEHRRQRKLLNPSFSTARIRRFESQMRNISCQLRDVIIEEVARGSEEPDTYRCEVDLAEYLGRAALEFVAQTGFGHTYHAIEGVGDKFVRAFKDFTCVNQPHPGTEC